MIKLKCYYMILAISLCLLSLEVSESIRITHWGSFQVNYILIRLTIIIQCHHVFYSGNFGKVMLCGIG